MNLLRISYGAVRRVDGNSEFPAGIGVQSLPGLVDMSLSHLIGYVGNQLALQEGNSTHI